jgi:hypothetical protein
MINTGQMAELMRPGLQRVFDDLLAQQRLQRDMNMWASGAWDVNEPAAVVDEPALPAMSVPVALALGAAAVVVKNPTVDRRRLIAWFGGAG